MKAAPPNEERSLGGERGTEENSGHVNGNSPTAASQALDFLEEIFGPDPEGRITISHLDPTRPRKDGSPSWISKHCSSVAEAAEIVEKLAPTYDVYVGICPRRGGLATNQRGGKDDVVAINAFFADFDVAGPNHQTNGKVYFPDLNASIAFIDSLPLRPSLIVSTGGGVHPYWILREPLILSDEEKRDEADRQLKAWGAYLRDKAKERGIDIDPVQELARVLRVPGSLNHKNGGAEPVTVIRNNTGMKYNVSDFTDLAPPEEPGAKGAGTGTTPLNIVVNTNAQPPAEKLAAIITNSNVFRQTWDRRRSSVGRHAMKDTSPSAYCLALATYAAQAGWNDQEITDLLVAWRRKENATPKPASWYSITITKACEGHEDATGVAERLDEAENATEPDDKLAALSRALGLEITRVVKARPPDPSGELQKSSYRFETKVGTVMIPSSEILTSHRRMFTLLYDLLGHVIPVRAAQWNRVLQQIAAVAIDEEAPLESSPLQEIRAVLAEYTRHQFLSLGDPVKAYVNHCLLHDDEGDWFSYAGFLRDCRVIHHMQVNNTNLPRMLKSIGSKRRQINNVLMDGKRTNLTFWKVPNGLL